MRRLTLATDQRYFDTLLLEQQSLFIPQAEIKILLAEYDQLGFKLIRIHS